MMRERVGIAFLVAAVVAMPASAATVVGQTALNDAKVDGVLVPAGTTVLSPSTVETGAYSATVHLATGHTLNLGPNSSARLAAATDGGISLAASTGEVAVGTSAGEVFKLASNTVAMVAAEEPGGGDPVVKVRVCDEDNNLILWDAADLANCEGCYLPDPNDPDDPSDDECKGKAVGIFGISTGAAIGIGVGALVAGYLIGEGDETTRTEQVVVLCGVPDASGNVPPGTNPPGVGGCP